MKTVSSYLKKELVGSAGLVASARRDSRRGSDQARGRPTSRIRRMQIVLLVSAGYNGVLDSK
jgi:hypothetical protein